MRGVTSESDGLNISILCDGNQFPCRSGYSESSCGHFLNDDGNIAIADNNGSVCAVLWALLPELKQESPAVADKPARRLRKVLTVYVRAVGL